jgi:oligopeptidase B
VKIGGRDVREVGGMKREVKRVEVKVGAEVEKKQKDLARLSVYGVRRVVWRAEEAMKVKRSMHVSARVEEKKKKKSVSEGGKKEVGGLKNNMLRGRGRGWTSALMKEYFGVGGEESLEKMAQEAPVAKKIASRRVMHNQALRDDYHYMTQLHTDKLSQNYLAQEDFYAKEKMKNEYAQYSKVFAKEIMSQSLNQHMESVPEVIGEFKYYVRQEEGKDMGLYCRKPISDGKEQILLDSNSLLNQHKQINIGSMKINSDQSKFMVLVDTKNSETFDILIRDCSSPSSNPSIDHSDFSSLPVEITGVSNAEWSPDGKSFFYSEPDSKSRPSKIFHHTIGTPRSQDKLIYSEDDDQFFVDVARTKDRKFITLNSNSKTTSELRILDPNNPNVAPTLVMSRQFGTEFFLDHIGTKFIIVTADTKTEANYKIMTCEDSDVGNMKKWEELVPSSADVKIDDLDIFGNFVVIYERHVGSPKIRVLNLKSLESKYVELPSEVGSIEPGSNLDPNAKTIRFTFSSPIIPGIVYDYHLESGELEERRRIEIPKAEGARKAFDPKDFTVKRVWVESSGNVKVPMTIVHRNGIHPSSDTPTILQAYGAYGHNLETGFDIAAIPLLERDWCIAFAHIRGGGEMGLKWHHNGRLINKRNSFQDLNNCAQWLFDQRITSPDWLVGKAASAGGLPFAVLANEKPGMFKALVLRAPFLDLINTMLDPNLPLTVHEYDEWGNPNHQDAFENMFSYDPYWNIRTQEYPHMYIQSSLIDIRVPCWNHARYVAKLRSIKTDKNEILLSLDSQNGHFGDSSINGVAQSAANELSFIHGALNIVPSRI